MKQAGEHFYILVRINQNRYRYAQLWHNYYLRYDAQVECERWLDQHYSNNRYRNSILENLAAYYTKDTEELVAIVGRDTHI